jgi:hypothetical protein
VLIVSLSYFTELESELVLLGSEYNTDLTSDEMEALSTRTRWALESLSSRVPPLAAHSLPNSVEED